MDDSILFPATVPIVKDLENLEVAFRSKDPNVLPLIALAGGAPEHIIMTRYTPSAAQRHMILGGMDIFLCIETQNRPLQPVMVFISGELDPASVVEYLKLDPQLPE